MIYEWFKENKIAIFVIGALLLCLVIGWVLYTLFGHQLINAIYEGRSIGILNKLIKGQAVFPIEEYYKAADTLFSGIFIRIWSFFITIIGLFIFFSITDHKIRVRVLFILLAVLVFLLLRFINLNSDFPRGIITRSGVLYTDEGWYASAPVRHAMTGEWYLVGDCNPAVIMPVGQVLHRFTFLLFGIGLSSARITTTVAFVLMVVLISLFVRRRFGSFAAMLTALILATNYVAFAYSRLAIMENVAMFFVIASLFIATGLKERGRLARLLISSVLLGAGILTKTTSIFAMPLLAYLAWEQGTSRRERIVFLAASGLMLLCVVGGYFLVAKLSFPQDFGSFVRMGFEERKCKTLIDWARGILKTAWEAKVLGVSFIITTGLSTFLALLISRQYRRSILIHVMIGYIVVYIAILSLISYHPSRYYLPLIVPFAGLLATASVELWDWLRKSRWNSVAILPIVFVAAIAMGEGRQVIAYMSNPKYSFYEMAREVGDIIQKREGQVKGVVLLGDIANSVSLEIGTRAVSATIGTSDIKWRLKEYRPKYLLVIGEKDEAQQVAISEGADAIKLASWDVFDNYYSWHPVELVFLDWNRRRKW